MDSLTDSLAYTTISAPISGMMDEKSVSLGQNVDSGTILGKVKNISPINAVIEVTQTKLDYIKVGQKAKVKIGERDALVYGPELGNRPHPEKFNPSIVCNIGIWNILHPGIET